MQSSTLTVNAFGETASIECLMQGVRRVQILLKGLDPKLIYNNNGKELKAKGLKPSTEFIAPSLRFKMPTV